jgi:hypothetical protein
MKGQTLIWTSQEVVKVIDRALQVEDFTQSSMLKYLYCPLVWMTGNICVYGYFAQTERFVVHFRHTSSQDLPPEFKARLLLLGVPT